MNAALAVRTLEEITAQYGPMRKVLHHTDATDTPAEQRDAFTLNVLGGKTLRESTILAEDGTEDLQIRFIEYIDPVTLKARYAADYWSVNAYWTTDHEHRAVVEAAYVDAVVGEFKNPTLPMDRSRFTRGLIGFYDATDVI